MIQMQSLLGDRQSSSGVSRGHRQSFANNSGLKRAADMGVVSLCLSCQAASTDMQHDLLSSTCDLDLRSNIDLTLQGHHVYVSTPLAERITMVFEFCRWLS